MLNKTPTKRARKGERKEKLRIFAQSYAVHHNATKAAKDANYSPKTARTSSKRMVQHPVVQKELARIHGEMREKFSLEAETVLKEIAKIAFADIRNVFDENGNLKPPHEWDDKTAASVASLEVNTIKLEGVEIGRVAKVKMWQKLEALELLARHLGLFNKDESNKPQGITLNIIAPSPEMYPQHAAHLQSAAAGVIINQAPNPERQTQ